MCPSRHKTLFNPLLQVLQRGVSHACLLGAGTYGSVTGCWVKGHGLVALKHSNISADALRAEAEINRRILPHPCIAQVGALQHSLSAQERMSTACLSRSGIQPSLPSSSCVAQMDAHLHTAFALASRFTRLKRQCASSPCVLAPRLPQGQMCSIMQAPLSAAPCFLLHQAHLEVYPSPSLYSPPHAFMQYAVPIGPLSALHE